MNWVSPLLANVPILYPLKTLENLWFSGSFRGYEIGTLARNGLRQCSDCINEAFRGNIRILPSVHTSKHCLTICFKIQKQSPEVFYKEKCSEKFRKIHRKIPVPVSFLK